ncbi:MAG: hypothetical protein QXU18_12710 [Thermoplasmatales archaeon]
MNEIGEEVRDTFRATVVALVLVGIFLIPFSIWALLYKASRAHLSYGVIWFIFWLPITYVAYEFILLPGENMFLMILLLTEIYIEVGFFFVLIAAGIARSIHKERAENEKVVAINYLGIVVGGMIFLIPLFITVGLWQYQSFLMNNTFALVLWYLSLIVAIFLTPFVGYEYALAGFLDRGAFMSWKKSLTDTN